MSTATDAPTAAPTYTHVGYRAYTGHYAVTEAAERTPGKTHALNADGHRRYKALCGVVVHLDSDDNFCRGGNPVWEATPISRVECRRCRKRLGQS